MGPSNPRHRGAALALLALGVFPGCDGPVRAEAGAGEAVMVVGRPAGVAAAGPDGALYYVTAARSRGRQPESVMLSRPGRRPARILREGEPFGEGNLGPVLDMAVDPGSGVLYILHEGNPGDGERLRIIGADGRRHTVQVATIGSPGALAVGPGGELYLAGACQVVQVEPVSNARTPVVGAPCSAHGSDDRLNDPHRAVDVEGEPALSVLLHPTEIAVDGDGHLWLIDSRDRLLRVGADRLVEDMFPGCRDCGFDHLGSDPASGGVIFTVGVSGPGDSRREWAASRRSVWMDGTGSLSVVGGTSTSGVARPPVASHAEASARPVGFAAAGPGGDIYRSLGLTLA